MARPTKSAKMLHPYSQTKDEIRKRAETEEKIRGAADKLKPPSYLNKKQKKIFKNIVAQLEQAEILGNLDIFLLEQASICIDRLQELEKRINENVLLAMDPNLIRARNSYAKDFQRYCNELSLSPQSRAKLGNLNLQKSQEEKDPLLKVLAGGKLE